MGRIFLGALIGLVAGAALVFGGGLLAAEIFQISQREGAYAMGLIFFMTPAGAIVGAIVGGVAGWLTRRR